MKLPRTRSTGVAMAFVTAMISGVAVYTNGFAVKRFKDATVYTTAKNGVAALVLLGLLAAVARRKRGVGRRASLHRAGPGVIAIAVVGGSVPFVLFFEGLARAQSVQAAFIHKTLVAWVALLAVPLLRERVTGLHLGAIVLLIAGQVALADDIAGLRPGTGEMMILAATLLWAVETVIAKRVLGSIGAVPAGAARMGLGLIVLFVWLASTGRAGAVFSFSVEQWRWVLLTGAILAGYVATWYAALARAQAVDVTAVLVFGAVVTAVLAGGFQSKPVGPDAVGLGLVTLGTLTAAAASTRRRRRVATA